MSSVNPLRHFNTAVQAIIRNWSGLQFAVQQGAGGPQAAAKEAWFISVAESWFYENENLLACEVADHLDEIIQTEFDLRMEDGSIEEVSSLLLEYFQLCRTQEEEVILEKLRTLPRCDLSRCICEDEEDENMNRAVNGLDDIIEDMEVSEPVSRVPVFDEDGFQMVLRSASRKKR